MAYSRDMHLHKWASQTVRLCLMEKKTKKTWRLSSGVRLFSFCFVLVCGNSRYPSRSNCAVSRRQQRRLPCFISVNALLSDMMYADVHENICAAAPWHHKCPIGGVRRKGHVIATYSVIRRAECHCIPGVTSKMEKKNSSLTSSFCFVLCFALCGNVCVRLSAKSLSSHLSLLQTLLTFVLLEREGSDGISRRPSRREGWWRWRQLREAGQMGQGSRPCPTTPPSRPSASLPLVFTLLLFLYFFFLVQVLL